MTLVNRSADIIPINAHAKRQYVFFSSFLPSFFGFPFTTTQRQILQ
jgi:hypothetical protein